MVTRTGMVMVALVAAACMFFLVPMGAAAEQVDAKTVAQHMDKSKYTSAEIKSYFKDLKGKDVAAQGKIDEIMTGRTGTRVVVFVDVPGKSTFFVVDVYVENAEHLHKGDRVSCKGEFSKYNWLTLNGITLKGACAK